MRYRNDLKWWHKATERAKEKKKMKIGRERKIYESMLNDFFAWLIWSDITMELVKLNVVWWSDHVSNACHSIKYWWYDEMMPAHRLNRSLSTYAHANQNHHRLLKSMQRIITIISFRSSLLPSGHTQSVHSLHNIYVYIYIRLPIYGTCSNIVIYANICSENLDTWTSTCNNKQQSNVSVNSHRAISLDANKQKFTWDKKTE